MIPKDEIERKDFSTALPHIILKVTAISEALHNGDDHSDPIVNDMMRGWGCCLEDIAHELKVINGALCAD